MKRSRLALLLVATLLATAPTQTVARAITKREARFRPHVVVATLDTGTNPFHPAWRRAQFAHPSTFIPGFPSGSDAIRLSFKDLFAESVESSIDELKKFALGDYPYWIPGTNIIGTWAGSQDARPIFDYMDIQSPSTHDHGASASSQIAGLNYGMAVDAYVVIMDRTEDQGRHPYVTNAEGLRWAADQPWIDIIHTNIQNPLPLAREEVPAATGFTGYPQAVAYALSKGKIVVSAGGNFYVEATETSPHAGPPGVLVAGANDNCGYTGFSNPDPHVVMDGDETIAAEPNGYGDTTFGGTSSASPRITGYVAELLLRIRRHYDYTGNIQKGALVVLAKAKRPDKGPLADGKLTAADLHEVVRKTADPNPHESKYDGAQSLFCIPQPTDLESSFYPKMGYGEVSEHTIKAAFGVAIGRLSMPERPSEDDYYERSEELRRLFWE